MFVLEIKSRMHTESLYFGYMYSSEGQVQWISVCDHSEREACSM